jgi:hypothetical protein
MPVTAVAHEAVVQHEDLNVEKHASYVAVPQAMTRLQNAIPVESQTSPRVTVPLLLTPPHDTRTNPSTAANRLGIGGHDHRRRRPAQAAAEPQVRGRPARLRNESFTIVFHAEPGAVSFRVPTLPKRARNRAGALIGA